MCMFVWILHSPLFSTRNRVQAELQIETKKTVELIDSLEQQSQHMYHAEPPVNMPYIPPNLNLAQKSGYLFQRWYVHTTLSILNLCSHLTMTPLLQLCSGTKDLDLFCWLPSAVMKLSHI